MGEGGHTAQGKKYPGEVDAVSENGEDDAEEEGGDDGGDGIEEVVQVLEEGQRPVTQVGHEAVGRQRDGLATERERG